uniref:Cytochrome P450 4d2 n=1 Tax=Cacopsylla melanoneura TaxID=428564 RepID=A0A8D8SHC0_9HEMI
MFPFGLLSIYLVSTLVCLVILYVWKYRRYYYLAFQIPGPSILRMLHILFVCIIIEKLEVVHKILAKFINEERSSSPCMIKFWYGTKLMIFLLEPNLIRKVYQTHLRKDPLNYSLIDPILNGPSIFQNNDIPTWKAHRKIISHASFSMTALKAHVKIFHEEAQILATKLGLKAVNGHPVEPEKMMGLSSLSMVIRTMSGLDFKIQQNFYDQHPFLSAGTYGFEMLWTRIANPWLLIPAIFNLSGYKKREEAACKQVRVFAEEIIGKIKAKVTEQMKNIHEDSKTNNFPCNYIEVSIRDQLNPTIPRRHVMTHDELVSEIIAILSAGMDTTKTTNTIILIMLALHPHIQQEMYDEIISVLGTDSTLAPSYDQLQQLHCLTRVIKETQRLYPAAPIVGRETDEELELDGYAIPKGANIYVPIYCGPHQDPAYWPDPTRFDPDRFLASAESPEQSRNPAAFMSFSVGPRNCLGNKYAMLQMKATISTILRRYRILPGERCKGIEDIQWELHMTMKLLEGNDIRLEPREVLGVNFNENLKTDVTRL